MGANSSDLHRTLTGPVIQILGKRLLMLYINIIVYFPPKTETWRTFLVIMNKIYNTQSTSTAIRHVKFIIHPDKRPLFLGKFAYECMFTSVEFTLMECLDKRPDQAIDEDGWFDKALLEEMKHASAYARAIMDTVEFYNSDTRNQATTMDSSDKPLLLTNGSLVNQDDDDIIVIDDSDGEDEDVDIDLSIIDNQPEPDLEQLFEKLGLNDDDDDPGPTPSSAERPKSENLKTRAATSSSSSADRTKISSDMYEVFGARKPSITSKDTTSSSSDNHATASTTRSKISSDMYEVFGARKPSTTSKDATSSSSAARTEASALDDDISTALRALVKNFAREPRTPILRRSQRLSKKQKTNYKS